MIKNPSDATVRRIMKENDVVQSAIQLANSGSGLLPAASFPRYHCRTTVSGLAQSLAII